MRALRFSVAVAIAVGLTLLAGDLWLRSIADAPRTAPDIAIHPPRISVVIARPAAKHTTPRQTPHTVARTPVELAAMPLPATAGARATPTTHHTGAASHRPAHHAVRTHRVTRHLPARKTGPGREADTDAEAEAQPEAEPGSGADPHPTHADASAVEPADDSAWRSGARTSIRSRTDRAAGHSPAEHTEHAEHTGDRSRRVRLVHEPGALRHVDRRVLQR